MRNFTIDNIRAFTILLVVLGHSVQYSLPNTFDDNDIFRLIYSFHMPLFMFISGYATLYSKKIDLLNKVKTLLLPYATWAIIYFFLYNRNDNFIDYLQKIVVSPDIGLWFLYTLFLLYVLLYVCTKISKKYTSYIGLALSIIILGIPINAYGICFVKWYFFFFIFGRLWNEKNHLLPKIKIPYLFVISLLTFVFLSHFWHRVNPLQVTILGHYGTLLYSYLTPLSGIAVVFSFFNLIKSDCVNKIGQYLGRRTLEIYTLNYSMIVISLTFTNNIAVVFVTALSFCLLSIYILNKIPIVRVLLFGKQ